MKEEEAKFTVQRGRKPYINVKWRPKQNPIGSKCLNQCTNQNPTRFLAKNSPVEVATASGTQRSPHEEEKQCRVAVLLSPIKRGMLGL